MKKLSKEQVIELLAAYFRSAEGAAREADPGEHADGGTCNLDTPAFTIKGVRASVVEDAARRAGVTVTEFRWFGGSRWWWLNGCTLGQGSRRSKMMEAAQAELRKLDDMGLISGFSACGYCQMD